MSVWNWHHLNAYDPASNTSAMQIVETSAPEALFPHSGSVSQFENTTASNTNPLKPRRRPSL
ncbi:HNH endonuclease [Kosakonia sp. R1.Fl]|uniref:HNH endonuclease n=1 Tax=Kosakonia sp. R1.Fl TaxID=2928706 RepID=UPI00201D7C56|nr:HNH endonuclease [Kosakonia sp. R1.Fl]